MSIEAMKQALEALVSSTSELRLRLASPTDAQLIKNERTITALRQAIEQAERQEPSLWFAIGGDGRVKYTTDSDRALKWKQAGSYRLVRDYYAAPIHAIDISQERVDETAKNKHEFECPRCGHCCQQREWVGLDYEQMRNTPLQFNRGALWAERYLKEKNA